LDFSLPATVTPVVVVVVVFWIGLDSSSAEGIEEEDDDTGSSDCTDDDADDIDVELFDLLFDVSVDSVVTGIVAHNDALALALELDDDII
jgi:hypothetical protein